MAKTIAEKIILLNRATLNSLTEPDRLLIVKTFTEASMKIVGADFGFAWWRNAGKGKYELAYKSPGTPYEPNPPRKRGGNYYAQKRGLPFFVADVNKQKYGREYDVRPYMSSYVIIPIVFNNRSYGNMILCFKKIKNFTAEDESLCGAVGNAMAQAMTINRLHHNLRDIKYTLDHTPEPVLIFDPGTQRVTYFNKSLSRQIGKIGTHILNKPIMNIIHPSFQKSFAKKLKHIIEEQIPASIFEIILTSVNGRKVPAEVSLQYVALPGQAPHLLAILHDLRERKKNEERIRHAAFHDALTGLPNRFLFNQRLEALLRISKQRNKRFGLIFLDLDRFKYINDILGHLTGDSLLKQVAERLRSIVKRTDIVSRHGGDEFVILLGDLRSLTYAESVARRIQKAFQVPFKLSGQEIYVNCSMGISLFPRDGVEGDVLMKNADNALYKAKEEGGNGYQQYHSTIVIPQSSRLEMEKELRGAVKKKELRLHYQPVIDLQTGAVHGAEALVRWQHPTMGLIAPAAFIPQAEESGLIIPIGEWVFAEASRQLKKWHTHHLPITVSINISARELLQKNMLGRMRRLLRTAKIPPEYICLELTETFLIKNMEASIAVLQQFRELGFKTAIDDFGTGYASLSYLKRLPIDYIKIDQSFVFGSTTNPQDAGIIEAIIAVAHHLGIKVIAEGVEKANQAVFLKEQGCDLVQGNYYSIPLAPDAALKALGKSY